MDQRDQELSSLLCSKCGGVLVANYVNTKTREDDVDVYIEDCPFLVCEKCNEQLMDIRAISTIKNRVEKAKNSGETEIHIQAPHADLRYGYCEEYSLDYDGRDYQSIPGLYRPWNDGKLTPVFFNRSVLTKFFTQPEYFMSLHSASYGGIGHIDNWSISYGINQRNEVIMWLGDIAELPENEIYYLKSENIPSSHDIFSDFYMGQIEVKYGKPSVESKLIENRNTFFKTIFENFKLNLSHLDNETIDIAENIVCPPVWTESIVKNIIDGLNKLCNESLNSSTIKKSLKAHPDISENDLNQLGSLKLFGIWIEKYLSPRDIRKLMLPLYVLYDYRVYLLHLQSNKSREKILTTILERLAIDDEKSNYESIYTKLIILLNDMWDELISLADNAQPRI